MYRRPLTILAVTLLVSAHALAANVTPAPGAEGPGTSTGSGNTVNGAGTGTNPGSGDESGTGTGAPGSGGSGGVDQGRQEQPATPKADHRSAPNDDSQGQENRSH